MPSFSIYVDNDLYNQIKELDTGNMSNTISTLIKLGIPEYTKLSNSSDKVLESYYLNNIYTSVKGLNEIRKKRIEGGLEG